MAATAIDPKTLARLDAKDGSVNAAFNLDVQPGAVAIGFDSAWVVEPERDRIVRVRLEVVQFPTQSRLVGRPPASPSAAEPSG